MNNAGISGPTAHIDDVAVSEWGNVFRATVECYFVGCKVVVPYIRKQRAGSVIFISSNSASHSLFRIEVGIGRTDEIVGD
ncbi:SDR family NAD(P)-dependent oxidoreductase [Bradyrhizobium sp. CCGB20]|uniref:SDR family NAD(P)-dependent oxidoreductase n=1 Tax=unclassified Bradyrhizobium TaxID=2631580 RepID=UPI0035C730F5